MFAAGALMRTESYTNVWVGRDEVGGQPKRNLTLFNNNSPVAEHSFTLCKDGRCAWLN